MLAQEQKAPQKQQGESLFDEELVSLIEARLGQPGGDTARFFILENVRAHCGGDYACLQSNYDRALTKLEAGFHHFAGLLVATEMARLAEQKQDLTAQAGAVGRLAGIYGFIGNRKMQTLQQEKLISLYEQLGDTERILKTKANALEGRVWYLGKAAEVLPELLDILQQGIENGFTDFTDRLRIRIKYVCEEHGLDEEFRKQVEALEAIPLSTPLQPSEYHIAFHAASGRGDLLRKEKKYDQARAHYLKALQVFQRDDNSHHDTWLVIYALFRLAKLEWELKDATAAKKFLDEAYSIADRTQMHDRAIMYLWLKTEIAEAENDFEGAYRSTREIMSRQAIIDSVSEGFDMEKYTIQGQLEQMEAEKDKQALAFELNSSRLKFTIAVAVLVAMLAFGLFIGLYKQRKGKQALATQNTLTQQQAQQLKQLDAAKSRFFANISHELRTPLTLMLGPVKTLLEGQHPPGKQAKLLNMALQNGQQLGRLVNEILDLRKLEMGKMGLYQEPTELSSFFNQYASQFESLTANRKIGFSYETNIGAGVTAAIDQEKCRQILQNLLSNAFKFTPAGGRVTTKLSLEGNILTMEVADTGAGIHPDDLPHVFDRFYQTARPDKTAQGGTGIGLALCKECVKLFGGKMEVESQLGTGSVFRAIFPVTLLEGKVEAAAAFDSTPVPQSLPKPENGPQKKLADGALPTILVVEDNPDLQDYIRLILEDSYNIVTAENGQEAWQILTANDQLPTANCQLILSDLMMPVMDGHQLLEKLKSGEATRHIPVIMLTARAEARDRLKALRIGVDDYMTKPFDEEELLVRIENLLANHAVRQEAASETAQETDTPNISQPDQEWLETFEVFVQKNLSNNILNVDTLAYEFAMSKSTLQRQLKRLTGLSPQKYLLEIRFNEARQLLEQKRYDTIERVAYAVGYADARSFSRSFKLRFGKLPSEVINN